MVGFFEDHVRDFDIDLEALYEASTCDIDFR